MAGTERDGVAAALDQLGMIERRVIELRFGLNDESPHRRPRPRVPSASSRIRCARSRTAHCGRWAPCPPPAGCSKRRSPGLGISGVP